MKINIKEKDIELKYSFRSMMIYEKITNTSFQPQGITEILIYFYSTIISSDKTINLTFDEFMDWIDNNPNEITEFSQWLTNIITKNNYINNSTDEEKTEENPKKD